MHPFLRFARHTSASITLLLANPIPASASDVWIGQITATASSTSRVLPSGDVSASRAQAPRAGTTGTSAADSTAFLPNSSQGFDTSRLEVGQTNSRDRLIVLQEGIGHSATAIQEGDYNTMAVTMQGAQNTLTLQQIGSGQSIVVSQSGLGNQMSIVQIGKGNVLRAVQR